MAPRPGSNVVTVKARDARGNTGESTVSFHFGGLASAGGLRSGTVRAGRVYTWGRNHRGQLGLGAEVTTDQRQPQAVPGLESATSIAFNQNFAMALSADGTAPAPGSPARGTARVPRCGVDAMWGCLPKCVWVGRYARGGRC